MNQATGRKWFVIHRLPGESPWSGFDTLAEAQSFRRTALDHFQLAPFWLYVRARKVQS